MAGKLLILALFAGLFGGLTPDPLFNAVDTADQKGFQEALRHLTSPELEHRKKNRREYQQRHYAEILFELTLMDAPGALLAWVRSRTQLELQLPNTPLTVTIPITQPPPPQPGLPGFTGGPSPPLVIPLFEDRQFPPDPWSDK